MSFVSIHAPARGATKFQHLTLRLIISFNSRARKGRDGIRLREYGGSKVSIHAPARGATFTPARIFSFAAVSIHAPARGATCTRCRRTRTERFNSRARKGRDRKEADTLELFTFQFTRPQGARPRGGGAGGHQGDVSIHAPARGATLQRMFAQA